MDHIPSMAAISAATQKAQLAETASLTAKEAVAPVAASLDPRSVYSLAPGTADAVLSLTQIRTEAVQATEASTRYGHVPRTEALIATAVAVTPIVPVEPSKSISAANRNWNEDVRLAPAAPRKVGADLVVEYDNPRVMAAWSAAFPDIAGRKFRGLQVSETHVKSALARAAMEAGFSERETDIYLLCNDEKFRTFSDDHPNTKINWINVDDEKIMIFWPKRPDLE